MKLKKVGIESNYQKLFSLKLLKTKIFSNTKKIQRIKIKKTELYFKKAFHIIYKFHTSNKKILFIEGQTKEKNRLKYLLNKTRHKFLPNSIWLNGAISNSLSIIKHLVSRNHLIKGKKPKSDTIFETNKQYNLIVVLNDEYNPSMLKELLNKHVPIIILNDNLDPLNCNTATYKILGNFGLKYQKTRNNCFYTILNSIFKKAEKYKKTRNFKKQKNRRFKRKNETRKKKKINTFI